MVNVDPQLIVSPYSWASFIESHYEKSLLHIPRNITNYFDDVLRLETVDDLLANVALRPPALNLVDSRREQPIPQDEYVSPDGFVDVGRAMALFSGGATIVLNQLHNYVPSLRHFRKACEAVFTQPFQTNIYLTPPRSKGFKIHFDTHDVFVLQVHGSKIWRLYGEEVRLPLASQYYDLDSGASKQPVQELMLNPGDTLYLPRGILHDCITEDSASLHITVGAIGKTWADFLLHAVKSICTGDESFRKSLPPGYASPGYDRAEARRMFQTLMERAAQNADFDAAFDHFVAEFVGSRPSLHDGHLANILSLDSVGENTVVRMRPHTNVSIQQQSDKIRLRSYGVDLSFPAETGVVDFLTRITDGSEVCLSSDNGPLDVRSRVTIAKRLIQEGILVT